MNLNNLITPETAMKRLKAAVLGRAVWGTVRVTADEDLVSGMLEVEFSRSHGVTAILHMHVTGCRREQQRPFRRNEPVIHGRVCDIKVTVSAGQMTCKPSIAIAQATLHRDVAELACALDAMAAEWTVGELCDEDGRTIERTIPITREKVHGA